MTLNKNYNGSITLEERDALKQARNTIHDLLDFLDEIACYKVIDEDDADNYCNFNDIGVALKVIDTLVDSKSFEMKG